MNGKDNIINKILSDAEAKCQEILAEAQSQAQEVTDNAEKSIQAEEQILASRLEKLSDESLRNGLAAAQLSARKYKLLKKQQLISVCYEKALQEICALSAPQKKQFIQKLLREFAEDGETVLVAEPDEKIVDQKFLNGIGKNLVWGGTCRACGGVILQGAGYDKDLTLEKLVAYARERTESDVAKALFGE